MVRRVGEGLTFAGSGDSLSISGVDPCTAAPPAATLLQTIGAHCTNGELCVDTELSESIESLELDTRCRIDSSEELDFKLSNLSRSSSLKEILLNCLFRIILVFTEIL